MTIRISNRRGTKKREILRAKKERTNANKCETKKETTNFGRPHHDFWYIYPAFLLFMLQLVCDVCVCLRWEEPVPHNLDDCQYKCQWGKSGCRRSMLHCVWCDGQVARVTLTMRSEYSIRPSIKGNQQQLLTHILHQVWNSMIFNWIPS